MIKMCGSGDYLVHMDPTIIEQLKKRYSDYDDVEVHDYEGELRIKLQPDIDRKEKFNHIEVDVPPGCYVVWTRVCYNGNEETNKVMAIVDCGKEVCVNLLLDEVETCSHELAYPFGVRGLLKQLPEKEVGIAVKALMQVAGIPKKGFVRELERRLEELQEGKEAQEYLVPTRKLLEIVKSLRIKEEEDC